MYPSLSKSRATHLHMQPPRYPLELDSMKDLKWLEQVSVAYCTQLVHAALDNANEPGHANVQYYPH